MDRYRTYRNRIALRLSIVACAGVAGLIAVSAFCRLSITIGNTVLTVGGGNVNYYTLPPGFFKTQPPVLQCGWVDRPRLFGNLPHLIQYPTLGFTDLLFPLWIPFVLSGAMSVWLERRGRRPSPGHCLTCGYDLTGNTSGVCSECGLVAQTVAAAAAGMSGR